MAAKKNPIKKSKILAKSKKTVNAKPVKSKVKKLEVSKDAKTRKKKTNKIDASVKNTRTKGTVSSNREKEAATAAGEPYIAILSVDVDPLDINNGSFELDWNDKFILNLIKAGYKLKKDDTENDIIDRWFQTVCRNIVLEVYEQQQADPENRGEMRVIRHKDIGNGRTEVS